MTRRFERISVSRLQGPSLRERDRERQRRREQFLRQRAIERLTAELERAKQQRRSAARARRTARADRIGYAALRGREPDWANGGVYLAEDDGGHICAPRADRPDWYTGFAWWKPLHALAWLRTAATARMVFVEGE